MNKIKKIHNLFWVILNLSGCSSTIYNSNFTCPDAKGLTCEMLNAVDKKIDSGEIEKNYSEYTCRKDIKCKYKLPEIQNNKALL